MTLFKSILAATAVALSLGAAPQKAEAQASSPLLGQLILVGFPFCPRGWTNADGQLLAISSNQALYSLYGTMYGGDGRTTFGLPDLRGRVAMHTGTGPGLSPRSQGAKGGTETNVMTVAQMPAHSHIVNATNTLADQYGPAGDFLADAQSDASPNSEADVKVYHDGPANVTMDPGMIASTGGSQSQNNMQPFQALRWCVALQGIFPSRN